MMNKNCILYWISFYPSNIPYATLFQFRRIKTVGFKTDTNTHTHTQTHTCHVFTYTTLKTSTATPLPLKHPVWHAAMWYGLKNTFNSDENHSHLGFIAYPNLLPPTPHTHTHTHTHKDTHTSILTILGPYGCVAVEKPQPLYIYILTRTHTHAHTRANTEVSTAWSNMSSVNIYTTSRQGSTCHWLRK